MKRKWIWSLAALPLIIFWVVAKPLADKRPQLVARDVDATGLVISPDQSKALARGIAATHIVNLKDGSQISIPGNDNSRNFFSPDGKEIYQLSTEREKQHPDKYRDSLVVRDADSGRAQGQFQFANNANLYGVWWHGNEIIAESPRQTWHFDANTLRLLNAQPQHRTLQNRALQSVTLCPDGKTGAKIEEFGTDFYKFFDLDSGKMLWKLSNEEAMPSQFPPDGAVVLTQKILTRNIGDFIARDLRTGAEKWRLRGPQSSVLALAPDESAIYEARENGELWKWPR